MLSRRSIFSLFAGTAAIAAGARVAASPAKLLVEPVVDIATPEAMKIDIMIDNVAPVWTDELSSHTHEYTYAPVNVRSDGSIRHRQHHPVDFPPKR